MATAGDVLEIVVTSMRDAFLAVTVFVAAMVLLFSWLQYATSGRFVEYIRERKKLQPVIGALMGLTPGCGGAIVMMPMPSEVNSTVLNSRSGGSGPSEAPSAARLDSLITRSLEPSRARLCRPVLSPHQMSMVQRHLVRCFRARRITVQTSSTRDPRRLQDNPGSTVSESTHKELRGVS